MDKNYFYSLMNGEGNSDYELYLKTQRLFSCQEKFDDFCNGDELQFQIVHQNEELLMKLIAYTLLEIEEYLQKNHTNYALSLFSRVHKSQKIMLDTLELLNTMAPKKYQAIRLKLGNGSGRDSPGFKSILRIASVLWETFETNYLGNLNLTLIQIYDSQYSHSESYLVAEALLEFDAIWQRFIQQHIELVNRSIGLTAKSLKGNPTEMLNKRLGMKLFPELWKIRGTMSDSWGQQYGYIRESLCEKT